MKKKLYKVPMAKFHKLKPALILSGSGEEFLMNLELDNGTPVEATEGTQEQQENMSWGLQW